MTATKTDEEVEAMTAEEFENWEREFTESLGGEVFAREESNEERIESIMKRAKVECVVKSSADFVVESFGRGLMGITDALIGVGEKKPKPRKRSF